MVVGGEAGIILAYKLVGHPLAGETLARVLSLSGMAVAGAVSMLLALVAGGLMGRTLFEAVPPAPRE
jgi:hypothetical protein